MNLKNYPQTSGSRAVALSKAARKVEREFDVRIALCPQPLDVRACAEAGVAVYAQHFDRVLKPESTGWTSLEALAEAGCTGALVNHSEHRLPLGEVMWAVDEAKRRKVDVVLCTKDSDESGKLASTNPTMVAVEPPELIGGDVSVTTADPSVVRRSVDAVRVVAPETLVLCGAGIKNQADVAKAVALGAHGILVASGVTKAKKPDVALRDLAMGFRRG